MNLVRGPIQFQVTRMTIRRGRGRGRALVQAQGGFCPLFIVCLFAGQEFRGLDFLSGYSLNIARV